MFVINNENIDVLVEEEFQNACKYDNYHSNHEYYAILKEEVEEAEDEMKQIQYELRCIGSAIKRNDDGVIKDKTKFVKRLTYQCIKELIQVLAVIKKYETRGEK